MRLKEIGALAADKARDLRSSKQELKRGDGAYVGQWSGTNTGEMLRLDALSRLHAGIRGNLLKTW
jgi:hypothetical protein